MDHNNIIHSILIQYSTFSTFIFYSLRPNLSADPENAHSFNNM